MPAASRLGPIYIFQGATQSGRAVPCCSISICYPLGPKCWLTTPALCTSPILISSPSLQHPSTCQPVHPPLTLRLILQSHTVVPHCQLEFRALLCHNCLALHAPLLGATLTSTVALLACPPSQPRVYSMQCWCVNPAFCSCLFRTFPF